MPDGADQLVANRGDLVGQRGDDRDDIGQAGQPHGGTGEGQAETGGGDGRAQCPRNQKGVIARQGQRAMTSRGLGAGRSLRVRDDGRQVLRRAIGGNGDHHPGRRAIDDGVEDSGHGANPVEHRVGDGVGVRSGEPADFDPAAPSVSAAPPGRRTADRLGGDVCRGADGGSGPGDCVENRFAGAGRGGAAHQGGRSGQTRDRRCGGHGQVEPRGTSANRGAEHGPEPRHPRPRNHPATVPVKSERRIRADKRC